MSRACYLSCSGEAMGILKSDVNCVTGTRNVYETRQFFVSYDYDEFVHTYINYTKAKSYRS